MVLTMGQSPDGRMSTARADGFLSRVVRAVDDPANVAGIILYGSWAKDKNDAESDVDLLLIRRSGPVVEQRRTVLGVEVEIYAGTLRDLRQRLLRDHPRNNNFILNALREGVIYLDRTGAAALLMADAKAVWKAGPRAMPAAEAEEARKALEKMLQAAKRLSGRSSTSRQAALLAEMRSHQLVVQSIYLYHRVRRIWTAGFPELLTRLEAQSPALYALWMQYVEARTQEERIHAAASLVESVYE